jgi:hypothetical protein
MGKSPDSSGKFPILTPKKGQKTHQPQPFFAGRLTGISGFLQFHYQLTVREYKSDHESVNCFSKTLCNGDTISSG